VANSASAKRFALPFVISLGFITGCASVVAPKAEPPSPERVQKEAARQSYAEQREAGKTLEFRPANSTAVTPSAVNMDARLKARVDARWKALVSGDFRVAYEHMSPNARKIQALDEFQATLRRGSWRAHRILEAKCESDEVCELRMEITMLANPKGVGVMQLPASLTEIWIKISDEWYFSSWK
jgi:hypothetical protein